MGKIYLFRCQVVAFRCKTLSEVCDQCLASLTRPSSSFRQEHFQKLYYKDADIYIPVLVVQAYYIRQLETNHAVIGISETASLTYGAEA